MAHVSIIIDGKTYRMACDDGQEEHLRSLGEKLDVSIQTLKEGFGEIGDQRLAIMAGIMIADELAENRKQLKGLQAEIDSIKESRGALMERYQSTEETLGRALSEVAERVTRLTAKLNGAALENNQQKPAAE